MAKYKIIPSSRTIVRSPISIGHKAEKGVEAIEFDVTAWVETYGSGTLTVIMRRWGDAIPYPIALEIDENNKATWTFSDIDTARAGMAYAQLSYIVGDEVVKKSDIYTFCVMDSLTGEGDPPEAYESWLEHLQHLAAEAMAEVLDIEGIVTDKTLTVDGGVADAKKTGDELTAIKADLGELEESTLPKPPTNPTGASGQILRSKGNGQTEWADVGQPTDEQTADAVSGWLDEHPEAVAAIPDGAITEIKLSNSVINKFTSFQRSQIATARRTICGDNYHYLQGGCYVDSLDHYVLAFAPIDTSTTKTTILVEVDTDFTTVINSEESVNYGHCNDMTYNPNTDKIYVSSTGHVSESDYSGKVLVIEPSTLGIVGTVERITNLVSAISYDAENNVFYTVENVGNDAERAVFKYDDEFNLLDTLGEAYIIDPAKQVGQCSFVFGGQFVYVTESNSYGHKVWFNTFGENAHIWQTDNFAYYESEAVVERNGKFYLLSIKDTAYIYVYELSTNNKVINNNADEFYSLGTAIIKGQDLDELTRTGHYYETATSANLITNTPYPMTNSFSVDVVHTGYDDLMQIFTTSIHEVFVRSRRNNVWGSWISLRSGFKFRTKTIDSGNWYTAGFVTSGGKSFRFSIPMEIESSVNNASVSSGSIRILQGGNVILSTSEILTAFETINIAKSDVGLSFEFIMSTAPGNVVTSDAVGIQLYNMKILLG